uniref:Uncharacterized protein n=1 Tax=Sphaerodactylus townsendi TaxID=933632 RepID=A0ACB8F8V1_9SAUR
MDRAANNPFGEEERSGFGATFLRYKSTFSKLTILTSNPAFYTNSQPRIGNCMYKLKQWRITLVPHWESLEEWSPLDYIPTFQEYHSLYVQIIPQNHHHSSSPPVFLKLDDCSFCFLLSNFVNKNNFFVQCFQS